MSESADQKRTRRRWINLAELVAVLGVLIAGLTLWNSWSERRDAETQAHQTQATAQHEKVRFELHGSADRDGKSIALKGDDTHELRSVTVAFPSPLGVSTQDAVGFAIDRDWFADALLKATKGAEGGVLRRLPVLVTYRYAVGDDEFTRSGIYDVVWQASGGFPFGHSVSLHDFRFHERGGSAARLDAIWAAEKPKA